MERLLFHCLPSVASYDAFILDSLPEAHCSHQSIWLEICTIRISWLVRVYLDDISVFSRTTLDDMALLDKVFERMLAAGIKIRLSKCNFMQSDVECLGYNLSGEEIEAYQHYLGLEDDSIPWQSPKPRAALHS